MTSKNSQLALYKLFIDAFTKGHPGMTKYVNSFIERNVFFYKEKRFHFIGLPLQFTNGME